MIKYHIIYRHRAEYPAAVMCKFFGVSRSGCYAFVHRLGRPEKDAALAELIAQQRERSFRTYGYRRMWLWLKQQHIFCNPNGHEAREKEGRCELRLHSDSQAYFELTQLRRLCQGAGTLMTMQWRKTFSLSSKQNAFTATNRLPSHRPMS